MAALEALGYQVVGLETYAIVGSLQNARRYDFVVAKDGDVYGVEVKTTRAGRLRLAPWQVGFDVAVVAEGAVAPSVPGGKINGVIYRGVNFNTWVEAKWSQFELLLALEGAQIPHHTERSLPGGR